MGTKNEVCRQTTTIPAMVEQHTHQHCPISSNAHKKEYIYSLANSVVILLKVNCLLCLLMVQQKKREKHTHNKEPAMYIILQASERKKNDYPFLMVNHNNNQNG